MHDHLVEFYESDELLVESVCDFFAPAFQEGDPVILVATPEHREAIIEALAGLGHDVGAARRQGRFVDLDAAETLGRFTVDGYPDAGEFERVVGGLVQSTGRGNRKLRIYGEMVALMWDEGNQAAALRLESLWNDLSDTHPFTLLCAYPLSSIEWAPDADPFRGICSTHSSVRIRFAAPQAEPRIERSLAAEPDSYARLQGMGSDLTALKDVLRNAGQMGRLAGNKKTVSHSGPGALDYDLAL
jgi:hypothetical protein